LILLRGPLSSSSPMTSSSTLAGSGGDRYVAESSIERNEKSSLPPALVRLVAVSDLMRGARPTGRVCVSSLRSRGSVSHHSTTQCEVSAAYPWSFRYCLTGAFSISGESSSSIISSPSNSSLRRRAVAEIVGSGRSICVAKTASASSCRRTSNPPKPSPCKVIRLAGPQFVQVMSACLPRRLPLE
jgi:hypothetical protein